MARNINSAFRIREILNSVKAKADQTPVHQIWSELFDFSEKNQTKRNVSISRCLANLHDEVELVRREMLKLDYTPTLYEPSLDRCNIIFAVQSIMGQWKNIKKNITPEVVLALGFCSEILPNDFLRMFLSKKEMRRVNLRVFRVIYLRERKIKYQHN